MWRRVGLIVGTVLVLLLIAGAIGLFVVLPEGGASAPDAVMDHVRDEKKADRGSVKVLAQQDWGDGQLVLIGYEQRGVRRLGLGFVSEQFRGWRVAGYTEEAVEPDDVVVGSLLIGQGPGGKGQPPWSAAFGELTDKRIDKVEVEWTTGRKTLGPRVGDAYLVVEKGNTTARRARYLAKDGTEIAPVPIADESR